MSDPFIERPIPEKTIPQIISAIENSHLLIDRFGDWPSFHDAEIIKLTFQRGNFLQITKTNAWDKFIRESLTAQFYVFDWQYGAESPPYRESLVTLHFSGFERIKLDRFSHQNPIIGLGITYEYSENLKKELFAVDWGGCGVCEVSFTCESIIVLAVEPITQPHPEAKWDEIPD